MRSDVYHIVHIKINILVQTILVHLPEKKIIYLILSLQHTGRQVKKSNKKIAITNNMTAW